MPNMIAKKKQKYDGRNISVGDVFFVKKSDVRLLRALKRIDDLPYVQAMTAENTGALVPTPTRHGESATAEGTGSAVGSVRVIAPVDPAVEMPDAPSQRPEDHDLVHQEPKVEHVDPVSESPSAPVETTVDILKKISLDDDSSSTSENSMPENTTSESTLQGSEYSTMLRNRARALGISVSSRWTDARVQREIDEHNKKTYQRADLRSSE